MKKEKGITLITLVITVVLMLILAGTAIYSGSDTIQNSKVMAFQTEMQIVQAKVNVIAEKIQTGDTYYNTVGKDITTLSGNMQNKITTALQGESKDGFKYFDKEELKKIEIDGIKQRVLINFAKREVVSINGVKKEGVIYYRDDEALANKKYNVSYTDKNTQAPTFAIQIQPLEYSWKITASNIEYKGYVEGGTVKYRQKGDTYWKEAERNKF